MNDLPQLRLTIELLHPSAVMPRKAHASDACFDLWASEAVQIETGQTGLVPLGLAMELQEGWEALIRGRSGLASRGVIAHHGTVDHLYRKEVKVILHNFSGGMFEVAVGDRIAQLTFAPVYPVQLRQGSVELTARGGFGSTGQ